MDEPGYDALWTTGHHFQREGYEVFPNLVLLGTRLATQIRRLKFGCALNVLPMWYPIRLAEDFAQAGSMTGGRGSWASAAGTTRARSKPSARHDERYK